ncbi:MAG TPA: SAF domain-containing protein [Anaerolineales bacterium]|nr:SAF domain-containing protein [Anaerolineales bacterium]
MSRRFRIGILIALVGIGLAAIGLYVLSVMLRQSLSPRPVPTVAPPLTEQVVVTTHNVTLGTVLRAGDLRLAEVPVELVPVGAIRSIETALGRFAKVDLVTGEMVLDHNLADPTNINHDVGYIIDDSQVLMAFPATDLMSSVGVLQRGDIIDILVTYDLEVPVVAEGPEAFIPTGGEEETESHTLTFDAFQRVEITAMVVDIVAEQQQQSQGPLDVGGGTPQPAPTPRPADIRIQAYLLALLPQDALVLKHLKDTGATFDLVLRSPTSTQLFELNPVYSDYLTDRYELTIPK